MSKGLFAALYEAGRPFALIDTRERRNHVDGHWFGSINMPLSTLTADVTRLVPDRRFPIHLLDWRDAASSATALRLSQLGYGNVLLCPTSRPDRFGDGFVRGEFVWSKAFGEVVAHTSGLPEVTPADYFASHRQAQFFDVRPTAEYGQFTIPGSRSLPNSLMLANMTALKQTGQMALLHCAGRTRSIIGACTLKAAGYDGSFAIFKGGTQAWQLDGHDREHGADRLFAKETDNHDAVHDFLQKWDISHQQVADEALETFVAANRQNHIFDVSEDAASGQMAIHDVIKVSGTNLIQQTDRFIARYHVPVILLDHGSGSRAAFAAFWLRAMGFAVRVAYLTGPLGSAPRASCVDVADHQTHDVLSAGQLTGLDNPEGRICDFRPSKAYRKGHMKGSGWYNISAVLNGEQDIQPSEEPVVVVGSDTAHARETADLVLRHGTPVAGVYGWDGGDIDPQQIAPGKLASPVDEVALFAGRHSGNLQDSRDYLAWEEDLPEEIDQGLHHLWHRLLTQAFDG